MPSSIIIFKGEIPVGVVPTVQDLPGVMDIDVKQATQLNKPEAVSICLIHARDEEVLAHAGMAVISRLQPGVEYTVFNIQNKEKDSPKASTGA